MDGLKMIDIASASIKTLWIAGGAIVFFIFTKLIKKAARRTLERIDEGLENIEFEENFYVLTNKILSILSIMIFVIYVAYLFGMTDIFFAFITGASVFGLAIGIATKDIINNIISGIIIFSTSTVKFGDSIVVDGKYKGVVEDIKLRSIVLETEDGNRLILPSSFLLSKSLEIVKSE
jgi:small-conductance mechanosensitive channel